MRRLAAVAALTATVALAACGGSSSSPGETGPPRPPTGADEVVVRVVTEGGFTAESRRPAHLPQLSVFGDGRVVVTGPDHAASTRGRRSPTSRSSASPVPGSHASSTTARAAGLLDDAVPDYGDPGVTDQATTTVTVRADGSRGGWTCTRSGFRGRVSGVTPEQSEQRRSTPAVHRVGRRRRRARRRRRGRERAALRADRARGARRARRTQSDGETHAWPLGDLAGAECAVHTGADLARALDVARTAHEGDAWESAGATYTVTFRPLLPDERTCADLSPKR